MRTLEKEKSRLGRQWSKLRWMREGDAPSRFFFALLKTKRAREEITALLQENGAKVEDEDDILRELHQYDTALYKREPPSDSDLEVRRETLQKIDRKVTDQQNSKLIQTPSKEEIGRTVKSFKSEKSPGADGMTTEVLRELWSDSKHDVIEFVNFFWGTDQLSWKQQAGIIKLIPKDGNRELIKNWRPLTLLNTGYKLVSKIMANRLKDLLPSLVEPQQKGFIQGRKIADSVLNFIMCQEWAEQSEQASLFIKLDFEKAYDRVDHSYLWDVLKAMNFDKKFIALARGLVEGSTSKIHVNGIFSEEITIERGVKQGCPLAPLMFALSTQPLMCLLKEQQEQGNLGGLKLSDDRTALYNLYADDSGVLIRASPENLRVLQETVGKYERISGARLNLDKSIIIPIAMTDDPNWLGQTGCYIAHEGEVIKYLGYPIGWKLTDTHRRNFLLGKMEKKLGWWAYKMLTFEGRIVVLRHILKNIPTHLLVNMALTKETLVKSWRRFAGSLPGGKTWREGIKSLLLAGKISTVILEQSNELIRGLKHHAEPDSRLLRVMEEAETSIQAAADQISHPTEESNRNNGEATTQDHDTDRAVESNEFTTMEPRSEENTRRASARELDYTNHEEVERHLTFAAQVGGLHIKVPRQGETAH
ncbi:hypothetical protein R1sor_000060 [Riccia sorocarpa]|uniref:Reverse transcriptase domain-containing protein n=1 Tax=Riccia sorocarpa TaxID=122646 RepID=A0ABD3GS37_9MARC